MLKIKEINKKFIIFLIIFGLFGLFVLPVLAQDYGLEATRSAAGLSTGEISKVIGNLIGAVLSLVGVLFFALMLYGGITWMLARGNQEMEKKALNTITGAIIGIIIVVSSYAITTFVFEQVYQGKSGGGSGSEEEREGELCRCSTVENPKPFEFATIEGVTSAVVCTFLGELKNSDWPIEFKECGWKNGDLCRCTVLDGNYVWLDGVSSGEVCNFIPTISGGAINGDNTKVYTSCIWHGGGGGES